MSSLKTLALALSGPLLAVGLTATASPAGAAGGDGTVLSVPNGVRYEGCEWHRYAYSIDTGGHENWEAETVFRGPRGQKIGTDYLDSGTDPTSGKGSELICDDDPLGRYEVLLEVTFYDDDYNELGRSGDSDGFRLRKPHTRTTYTVDDQTPRFHQILTFRIVTKIEGPKGYVRNTYRDVALEARRASGWERLRGSVETSNSRGVAQVKGRWERRRPLAIRAVTLRHRIFDASASQPKRIG